MRYFRFWQQQPKQAFLQASVDNTKEWQAEEAVPGLTYLLKKETKTGRRSGSFGSSNSLTVKRPIQQEAS